MRQPQSPRYHWTCHKYMMTISKTLYSSTSGTFPKAVKRDGQQTVTVVYFYCLLLHCLGHGWQIVKCYVTYRKHLVEVQKFTQSQCNNQQLNKLGHYIYGIFCEEQTNCITYRYLRMIVSDQVIFVSQTGKQNSVYLDSMNAEELSQTLRLVLV